MTFVIVVTTVNELSLLLQIDRTTYSVYLKISSHLYLINHSYSERKIKLSLKCFVYSVISQESIGTFSHIIISFYYILHCLSIYYKLRIILCYSRYDNIFPQYSISNILTFCLRSMKFFFSWDFNEKIFLKSRHHTIFRISEHLVCISINTYHYWLLVLSFFQF